MRSIILTVTVLAILVGGFALYMSVQSAPVSKQVVQSDAPKDRTPVKNNLATQGTIAPTPTTQTSNNSGLGTGEDVWIQTYDRETGSLINEFRAARYDPPVDGVVHVIRPEARFYTRSGQVLTISARDGKVVMPEATKKSDRMDAIQGAPPTRGTLNQVTLGILDDPDAAKPSLVCTIPILSFDNDALRLNTEQTEIDGRIIPADRVPIVVRGDEYDFDGEGLSMRWNQRDQRLEHLEIAHGKRLVVKKPGAFGKFPLALMRPQVDTLDAALAIQLVNADEVDARKMSAEEMERRRQKRLAAARKAAALAATQKTVEPVAYRATFNNDVKLFEGETEIGTAERMLATFTFDKPPAATAEAGEKSADKPSTTQPAVTQPVTQPATQPTIKAASKPVTKKVAPAEAPVEQPPIEIRWSGKLVVVPMRFDESGLRSFDDRAMQFEGSPVRLIRQGSQIEAASVSAASAGNRFSARGSDQTGPILLKDPTGMKLVTPAIDVVEDLATLIGPSSAEMTVADDKNQPQKLLTSWKEKGTIHFVTDQTGQRTVDQATFIGGVDVLHPELSLKSDQLALRFAPGEKGANPSLKKLDAIGSVHAEILNKDQQQTITAGALSLQALPQPDGKLAFSGFNATGGVTLADAKQKLAAKQVDATFLNTPGADPSKVRIDQLNAQGDVVFSGTDGTQANAEVLMIQTKQGVEQITLQGKNASVADKQSKIVGGLIKIATDGSQASVVGAGTLEGKLASASGQASAPMTVAWKDSFEYLAAKNVATVTGDVGVRTVASDGSQQLATGKKMVIALADVTDAKPDQQSIGQKTVQSITLSEDVGVSSLLLVDNDPQKLLRRIHLFAPGVTVTMDKQGGIGPVTIPTGGRMLFEDRRDAAGATQPGDAAIRGAVAIEWAKSMTYDPAAAEVVLVGDVVVVHREPGKEPVQMRSQKLIAQLDSGAGSDQQQLKSVRAEGGASFTSPQIRFDAATAVYDPAANRIIARGSENRPVEMFDQAGLSNGTFEELWWNIKENRPERLKNVTASVKR